MSYFSHPYVSNSELKQFTDKVNGKEQMANLDAIYDQGTVNHHALLEPHKADKTHKDYELACEMAKTVLKDDLCKRVIMMSDFRREHEWYAEKKFGLPGVRCKTDGDTRMMLTIFEYKGLGITTESAFEEAIMHFNYDQAAHWYLNVTKYNYWLIAGVSKKHPDRLFKRLVDRNHKYYTSGGVKVQKAVMLLKQFVDYD